MLEFNFADPFSHLILLSSLLVYISCFMKYAQCIVVYNKVLPSVDEANYFNKIHNIITGFIKCVSVFLLQNSVRNTLFQILLRKAAK